MVNGVAPGMAPSVVGAPLCHPTTRPHPWNPALPPFPPRDPPSLPNTQQGVLTMYHRGVDFVCRPGVEGEAGEGQEGAQASVGVGVRAALWAALASAARTGTPALVLLDDVDDLALIPMPRPPGALPRVGLRGLERRWWWWWWCVCVGGGGGDGLSWGWGWGTVGWNEMDVVQ